jgi:hypothetical protein
MQNNANEGVILVPPTIVTQEHVVMWIYNNYPDFSEENVTAVLDTYAYADSDEPIDRRNARFETDGYGPLTAVNVSQAATGQQQRAYVSARGVSKRSN